ncbi:MAG: O-antigen ligase family protein, partial [Actinomycetota bacterium]|nr:O-antigen ligase family protein [Actinomycetota bacterium]
MNIQVIGLSTGSPLRLLVLVLGLALLVVTVIRPAVGCGVVALAAPLVGGLGRNVLVPLLRPSEAITLLVVFGALLYHLPQRRRRPVQPLDLMVAAYAIVVVVIPALVLGFTGIATDLDTVRIVLAPLQYLTIYMLFSRVDLTDSDRRFILNLSMGASVVIAAVGIAQLANLPGVRSAVSTYYVHSSAAAICQDGVCRPTSLLEHWASFGAYSVLQFLVALALITTEAPGFSSRWLTLVMTANGVAVLASQTQAAVVALLFGTVLMFWYGSRIPRQVTYAAVGLVVALIVFWPQVQARYTQQKGSPISQDRVVPQSLRTRIQYWDAYFLPVVRDHLWFGTGTVIPGEVPERLKLFVDNEYLRMAFRAGVIGVMFQGCVLAMTATSSCRQRWATNRLRRAVGAIAFCYACMLALMGVSGEYLTYQGVVQTLWI